MTSVLQAWVEQLSLMQQTVLLGAIRGPDGIGKRHKAKPLIRWYRRSLLLSAFDCKVLDNPGTPGGGSFTGPSISFSVDELTPEAKVAQWTKAMHPVVSDFMDSRDELPFHYYTHFMHGAEILGYKHPDSTIRGFWNGVYVRMVHALHAWPETEAQLDQRLGDTEDGWRSRADETATCSE